MTHQLLLHLHRSARLIEPGTVRVAERMPPDPVRQADEFGNPVELMLLEAFLVEGLPGLWIGEDPIPIFGIGAEAPPPKLRDALRGSLINPFQIAPYWEIARRRRPIFRNLRTLSIG